MTYTIARQSLASKDSPAEQICFIFTRRAVVLTKPFKPAPMALLDAKIPLRFNLNGIFCEVLSGKFTV